jgi:hypothetical protein
MDPTVARKHEAVKGLKALRRFPSSFMSSWPSWFESRHECGEIQYRSTGGPRVAMP